MGRPAFRPVTARDSSTAKGNARFFAVEAGAGALCCGEEIEWTIVDVCDMVEEADRFGFARALGEQMGLQPAASEADKITKTTT